MRITDILDTFSTENISVLNNLNINNVSVDTESNIYEYQIYLSKSISTNYISCRIEKDGTYNNVFYMSNDENNYSCSGIEFSSISTKYFILMNDNFEDDIFCEIPGNFPCLELIELLGLSMENFLTLKQMNEHITLFSYNILGKYTYNVL